jgi:hypothetical protein
MTMRHPASLALVVGLAGGACAMKEAPSSPTWADDVHPLLTGQCFHCHGAETGFGQDGTPIRSHGALAGDRYDIYDLTDYADAVGDMNALDRLRIKPARSASALLLQIVKLKDPDSRMPPPPALPLGEHEVQVLENWVRAKAPKGSRSENHRPRAVLVGAPTNRGPDLVVTLDVFDADGDQVLGRIEAGSATPQIISRSGRHTFTIAGAAGAAPRVVLSDGWERRVDLPLSR